MKSWLKLLRLMFKGICPKHGELVDYCSGCRGGGMWD